MDEKFYNFRQITKKRFGRSMHKTEKRRIYNLLLMSNNIVIDVEGISNFLFDDNDINDRRIF